MPDAAASAGGFRPLRILVVNWQDRLNPRAGGAEEHLHRIFGDFARRGHRVALLCSGWDGCDPFETVDGIEVHRTGGRHTFPLAAPRHHDRHLRGHPFDLVVEDLNKIPVLAPLWAPAPAHLLLVHHLFGATAFQEANPALAAATWLCERVIPPLYRGLPCVAVSESTRSDLLRRGLRPSEMHVIRNGVELDRLRPARERYPSPTIVYLGRLKRYKRVDLVLRTVARLRERGIDVRAVVAGKGDARPGLEEKARSLGVADRVRFPGFVTEAGKAELLSRSWVHLLTSPKEGWGIVSMEASACGTPSVVSDSPGLRETVRHGETGFIVPHGEIDALADAVAALLDPPTRDRMGRAARRMAEAHSWDRMADAFHRLALSLADPRRRSPTDPRDNRDSPGGTT